MGEQKLTVIADAQGFEQAAAKIDKVAERQDKLQATVEQVGEASQEAARQQDKLEETLDRVGTASHRAADGQERLAEKLVKVAGKAAGAALVLARVSFALQKIRKHAGLIPGLGSVLAGIRLIVAAIKQEIIERERLEEIKKAGSAADDARRDAGQDRQDRVENIASRRRGGGFETADAARAAQSGADRAAAQFTQLDPGSIDTAFGRFGDIGLSQKELTDAAILESAGKLNVDDGGSNEAIAARLRRQIERNREQIDRFRSVETVQGQGFGDADFAPPPGVGTERAQRANQELQTPGGPKTTARARLKEILPPDIDVEKTLKFGELFGSPEEFEAAKVGGVSPRGLTALYNDLAKDKVEIALPNQPGFGSQVADAAGVAINYELITNREFDEMLAALKQVAEEAAGLNTGERDARLKTSVVRIPESAEALEARGGRPLRITDEAIAELNRLAAEANQKAAEANERAAAKQEENGGGTVINNDNRNARFYGPDAESRRRRTTNGESERDRRKVG